MKVIFGEAGFCELFNRLWLENYLVCAKSYLISY